MSNKRLPYYTIPYHTNTSIKFVHLLMQITCNTFYKNIKQKENGERVHKTKTCVYIRLQMTIVFLLMGENEISLPWNEKKLIAINLS